MLAADRAVGATLGLSARTPELLAAMAEDQVRNAAESLIGSQFGAWRLLRLVGQGGMGAVFLAERIVGDFQQRAALKLVRPGIGMDDLATRFRVERQILAGLEHPNIARLLDGGAGPQGEPFLALEFVEGTDLRTHCDAHRLDLRARLRLFLTVCDAVAHAHARLVVHRDIKPGNILVAPDGTVKLLDFGVAKLVDVSVPAEATSARLRLYTPEYAAPEQIRGEASTTAADVYSLGVVLFELISGRRPFGSADRTTAAIEAAVLHEEAPRPSTTLTRLTSADAARIALDRRSTPAQLRSLLRGDLDLVVQRALRKPPEERYASVRALGDDVLAWLERRPVAARRGSTRYRVMRFVQRHAVASLLAAVALGSLLLGLGSALWQAHEARAQRDLAHQEADKARAALGFMTDLFTVADPEVTQGKDVTARELLARGAERIRTDLRDQPEARAELLHAMGQAHLGLGLYEDALPLLEEAADGAPDPDRHLIARAVARHELGRHQDVLDLLEPARPRIAASGDRELLARADLRLAMVYQSLNRLEEADAAYQRVLGAQREMLGPKHATTRDTELRYVSLLVLGDRDDEARTLIERIVGELRDEPATEPTLFGRALGAHAMVLSHTGPLALAEALRREQLALYDRIYGATHPRTLGAQNDLASVLFGARRYADAEPLFRSVLEERRRQFGSDHPAVATAASNLANTLVSMQRPEQALEPAQEALRVRLALYGERHHTTALTLRTVANIAMELGRAIEARPLLERAVAAYVAALGPDHPQMLGSLNDLVRARLALGDPDPGCALARRALTLSETELAPGSPELQYQLALLGACRVAIGDAGGKLPLQAALPILRDAYGDADRRVRIIAALQTR